MKLARALYDGNNTTDNVVRKQMLPKYLQDVVNFSRRSDLGENDVIALQKLVRKAGRMVDRLAQNGAPDKALKTSYKELLDAVKSCSDKALKRAIRKAVEEKSRYVAERIARTESARAWYQGFLKDTMDAPDVVAYRWVESTRHPTEDICDEYVKVDMYGLGPGIFPKDKAPELPAHPHCLCYYEKVYASEFVDKPELEQEYRIPQLGNEFSYFTHQGERFSTRRVMNSQYHIEVSDSVTLKPKMLHEMENQINESIKLMGIKDLNNFPTFVIGANNDLGGALGVYKPITNVLYISSDTLKRKAFAEYLKESKGAISANRLSTMIHELFHWKDAQEYIKRYGALTDQSRYIKKLCEQDEKKIDQLKAKGYNLYRISVYATRQLIMGRYDEVFTEYRTKILLKG